MKISSKYNNILQEPTSMECGLLLYPIKVLEYDYFIKLFSNYLLYDIESLNRLAKQQHELLILNGKLSKKTKFKRLREKNIFEYVINQYMLDNRIRATSKLTNEQIEFIKQGFIVEENIKKEIPKEQINNLMHFIEAVKSKKIKCNNNDKRIIELISIVTKANEENIEINQNEINIRIGDKLYILEKYNFDEFRKIIMEQNLIFMPKVAPDLESQEFLDRNIKNKFGKDEYDLESIIALVACFNPNLDIKNTSYYRLKAIFHSFLNILTYDIEHNYRANGCRSEGNKDIQVINLTEHLKIKDNPYDDIFSITDLSDVGEVK